MKSEHAKAPRPACAQNQSRNALPFFFVVRLLQRRQGRTNKNSCGAEPPHNSGLNKPVGGKALWSFKLWEVLRESRAAPCMEVAVSKKGVPSLAP